MEILPRPVPRERVVSGEIVYRDDLRNFSPGEKAIPYDQLEAFDRAIYEKRARLYKDASEQPPIMRLYEKYDTALSLTKTEALSREYTESLFALGGENNPLSFTDIITRKDPARSLEAVERGAIADLLQPDGQQLALEPSEYYPDIDVRKQDAILAETAVIAWHWETAKTALLDPEDAKKPYDVLVYPKDENLFLNQLDLVFYYDHHAANGVTETISLLSTQSGRLELSSSVWIGAYAESGYEGHYRKVVNEPSDEQVMAFLEAVRATVGDEPGPKRSFE